MYGTCLIQETEWWYTPWVSRNYCTRWAPGCDAGNLRKNTNFNFSVIKLRNLSGGTHPAWAYGIKPEVWGRVVPDPRAELQVAPARGPLAHGLGRPGVSLF